MSRRIRWLIASLMIALSVVLAACTGPRRTSDSDPSSPVMPAVCTKNGPVVFAMSGRQDSPAPALTGTMQAAANRAIDSGSAIGLVTIDGKPQLITGSVFRDPNAGNGNALAADKANYLGELESAVTGLRATAPHADVLDALDVAGRAVRAACTYGGTIYLEDSGLSETGTMDFRQQGLLEAQPSDVVAFLTAKHELPHMKGISVVLIGIGDTAPPQQPLSIAQRDNLIAIWSAIAKAGGASSIMVDSAPRSGAAPTGAPPVALVPVPAEPVWKPSDAILSLPDSGPVGFEPNTAVFRDSAAAATALRKIAEYLIANPSAKILLSGTTAHWPPGPGSLASDQALGLRRALACKAILVRLGAAPSQIYVQGLGWRFSSYQNDQGPDGTLLPGPAEHNRSVIVTKL